MRDEQLKKRNIIRKAQLFLFYIENHKIVDIESTGVNGY